MRALHALTEVRATPLRDATIAATSKVLVLTPEPLAGALLGLLLELENYEPAFALPGESPDEAVRRVRPAFVILLDASLDAAASDVFHARAKGTPVILFGTPRTSERVRALADERRLPSFTMPVDRALLGRIIRGTVVRRSVRDRRRPSARQWADGTLIYRDRDGSTWRVYDRRAGERRGRDAGANGYRAFVNEAGEEWRYDLTGNDAAEKTAIALERQLAAAIKQ